MILRQLRIEVSRQAIYLIHQISTKKNKQKSKSSKTSAQALNLMTNMTKLEIQHEKTIRINRLELAVIIHQLRRLMWKRRSSN